MKYAVLIFIALISCTPAYAADDLAQRLGLPRQARWELTAVDLETGKEIVRDGNAHDEKIVTASLVKLFTAGVVLENGPPDLATTILHDGEIRNGTLHGNIYLRGRGNALLTRSDLREAVKAIASKGIRRITGDIVADDTFFDTKGLERVRKGAGHAPAGALGIDLHTVAVTVIPTEPGELPKVTVEPPNDAVRLAMEGRTTATGVGNVKVTQIDDASYRVSGNIAAGSAPMKWRFALLDPAWYAAGVLKSELKQLGVVVEGKGQKGRTPDSARILTDIGAPPPETVLRDMNVNSLNVVADNLLLLLGAEKYGAPGTREKGLKVVKEFLETLGLPEGESVIADGSGLLEGNRVTAGYMARYLHKVAQRPWFSRLRDSLPRAGMDGTLRSIGYSNERYRVKSGRLENAFALAGYGVDGKGREIAFAYIVNMSGAAEVNLERSGAEMMKYLGTEVVQ